MNVLIIKYKKKRLYLNLIFGLVWLILGALSLWISDKMPWFNVFYIFLGLFYLGLFLWNRKYHYLTITDEYIKENSLFGKKLVFKDLTHIKKFTDEYTLKTQNKSLGINTSLMDEESKIAFEAFIKTIELPE